MGGLDLRVGRLSYEMWLAFDGYDEERHWIKLFVLAEMRLVLAP